MKFKFKFNLKDTLSEYRRILKIARKPSKEEFIRISKISATGIILMGVIGFIVQIFYRLVVG